MDESGHAGRKACAEDIGIEIAADDHEFGAAPLTVFPGAIEITVQQHVHRLEHIALVFAGQLDDAFHPE